MPTTEGIPAMDPGDDGIMMSYKDKGSMAAGLAGEGVLKSLWNSDPADEQSRETYSGKDMVMSINAPMRESDAEDEAGGEPVRSYVNPKTVIARWRAGEVEGRTWAIREYIYLQIKAYEANGKQYFESHATIAAKFGKGLTAESVHAATKGSRLVVRTGADGDGRRPWVVCTDSQERSILTARRKPQPSKRGKPCKVQLCKIHNQTSRQQSVNQEDSSSKVDNSSSKSPPQLAGRIFLASEDYTDTPPCEYGKEITTAPQGAEGLNTKRSETTVDGGPIPDAPVVGPMEGPSSASPGSVPLPGVQPQAANFFDDVIGYAENPRTEDDAYVLLVSWLKRLNALAVENCWESSMVDECAKELAIRFECGPRLRRQALCYILGEARGEAINQTFCTPSTLGLSSSGHEAGGFVDGNSTCPPSSPAEGVIRLGRSQ